MLNFIAMSTGALTLGTLAMAGSAAFRTRARLESEEYVPVYAVQHEPKGAETSS